MTAGPDSYCVAGPNVSETMNTQGVEGGGGYQFSCSIPRSVGFLYSNPEKKETEKRVKCVAPIRGLCPRIGRLC